MKGTNIAIAVAATTFVEMVQVFKEADLRQFGGEQIIAVVLIKNRLPIPGRLQVSEYLEAVRVHFEHFGPAERRLAREHARQRLHLKVVTRILGRSNQARRAALAFHAARE